MVCVVLGDGRIFCVASFLCSSLCVARFAVVCGHIFPFLMFILFTYYLFTTFGGFGPNRRMALPDRCRERHSFCERITFAYKASLVGFRLACTGRHLRCCEHRWCSRSHGGVGLSGGQFLRVP